MKNIDLSKIVRDRLLSRGAMPGDRCLVAFSGGQDSTALLLAMLSGWGGNDLTAAAHLDHAVRQGSEKEQLKVKELCNHLGVELRTGRLDPEQVSCAAKRTGSLEAALRHCRYRFLDSSARSMGAKWLLTGHTADDQAETVLFRMLRGMDSMSFSGIPVRRSRVIRPLLYVGREVTYRYCTEKGIEPLVDPSNEDFRFARNRIRNHTIPALKATFHPDLHEQLLRLSSLVERMTVIKEEFLESFGLRVVGDENGFLCIRHCRDLPEVLREFAVERLFHIGTGRWPSRSQLREALDHLYGRKRGRMSLPGGMILDSYGGKTYVYSRDRLERLTPSDKAVCLPVPGRLRLESAGVWITAQYGTLREPGRFPAGNTVLIRRKGLKEPLWVRRRHPGDRFDPLGTGGAKKLKDFLIDRKIPSVKREVIPLVFDDEGDIIWVAGIEISNKAALEGYEGEEAVVLKLENDGRRAREAGLRDSAIENPEEWSQEDE